MVLHIPQSFRRRMLVFFSVILIVMQLRGHKADVSNIAILAGDIIITAAFFLVLLLTLIKKDKKKIAARLVIALLGINILVEMLLVTAIGVQGINYEFITIFATALMLINAILGY